MRNIIIILSLVLLSAPAFKEPLTRLPDLHELRAAHSATLLPGGKVLITGDNNDKPSLASAELYHTATGTWSPLPDMLTGRYRLLRIRHTRPAVSVLPTPH